MASRIQKICGVFALGLAGVNTHQLYSRDFKLDADPEHGIAGDRISNSSAHAGSAHTGNASAHTGKKPHVIFILADDMGFAGVGYNSDERVKSPTIDQLAREGVTLNFHYTFAYCAPSRFALLTGRDAWKSEAGPGNFKDDLPIGTSVKYQMLPASLKEVGYKTHMVGKWHQGFHMKRYTPKERGFDTFFGILGQATDHETQEIEHSDRLEGPACSWVGKKPPRDLLDEYEPYVESKDDNQFGDDRYRERAIKIINEHPQGTPLFMYLALQMPHAPFQAPDEYAAKYSESQPAVNTYLGMLSHVDDSVKIVVTALKKKMMWDNTYLIFASDNGAEYDVSEGGFKANFPLKGFKGELMEGGVRVPAFVSGGAMPKAARGRSIDGLHSLTDWSATLATVTGHTVDEGGRFPSDGINNWEYIMGTKNQSERKNLLLMFAPDGKMQTAYWEEQADGSMQKYYHKAGEVAAKLYDLTKDPSENYDISHQNVNKAKMKEIEKKLAKPNGMAVSLPWFRNVIPEPIVTMTDKACKIWEAADGFMVPWADAEDENKLTILGW